MFQARRIHPWLAIVLLLLAEYCHASFVIQLQPDKQECFGIRSPTATDSRLSGDYDCWEEGEDRVRGCRRIVAWVDKTKGQEEVWRSQEGYSEDDFYFDAARNQRYRLCFLTESSEQARKSARVAEEEDDDDDGNYSVHVGFSLRVQTSTRSLPDQEMGPEALKAIELLHIAEVTHDMWHNIGDHFDFLRNREAVHRQLTGQINDRLMGWTIIETVVVISMALGQVWYWKTFFEQRRFL